MTTEILIAAALLIILCAIFEKPHRLWHRRYVRDCRRCDRSLLPGGPRESDAFTKQCREERERRGL